MLGIWYLYRDSMFDSYQSDTGSSLLASMAEQLRIRFANILQRQHIHRAHHLVAMMDFSGPSIVIGGSS